MQMEVTNRLGKCSEVAQRQETLAEAWLASRRRRQEGMLKGPLVPLSSSLPSVSGQREVHMVI